MPSHDDSEKGFMFRSTKERARRRRVATQIHVEAILRRCVTITDLCRRFDERSGAPTCAGTGRDGAALREGGRHDAR